MIKKTFVTGVMAAATAGILTVSAHAQETAAVAVTGLEQLPINERVGRWNADAFRELNAAVAAFELCRGKLNETAVRAVTNQIEALSGEPLSPGYALSILDDAKWNMKRIVIAEGCGDRDVKQAITRFNQYLLPSAQVAVTGTPATTGIAD